MDTEATRASLIAPIPTDIISATVPQLSRMSGLGESTIWKMIHDGEIETVSFGRRRLVLMHSFTQLLAEKRAGPVQDARRNNAVPALGTSALKARQAALNARVSGFAFSPSVQQALRHADIVYLGDLVQQQPEALLRLYGVGKDSLRKIEHLLAERDLHLGMDVAQWERPR